MERLNKQIENAIPVTREILEKLNKKVYSSEREIEVGDKILTAMLTDKEVKKGDDGIPELKLELITFHIDEINTVYEFKNEYEREKGALMPQLIKINEDE